MIIEAKKERALKEILVIAAALSVRDPRERPAEKQAHADQMHAKFKDPRSDFLSYLKLWDTYHATWKTVKTQNKMRKFCKEHFLSYIRMREWIDIHKELLSILEDLGGYTINKAHADYDSIHRSIVRANGGSP